jgi:hypothetical protein
MKLRISLAFIAIVLCAVPPIARSQEEQPQPIATEITAEKTLVESPSQRTAPKLNIVWSCGKCELNEKVAPLIEEAYRAAALKDGRSISEIETAEVTINLYHQRKPGLRVMFGFMAGKDRLGINISYKGKELSVSDYSANVLQGMNHLCESVANKAYEQMAKLLE